MASMRDMPIACTLDGAALGRRQADLRDSVLAEAEAVERLADGYRWRFRYAADLLTRLGPVLDAERHCCPFLLISIVASQDRGTVTLEISGPSGTADFLESWITPGS